METLRGSSVKGLRQGRERGNQASPKSDYVAKIGVAILNVGTWLAARAG